MNMCDCPLSYIKRRNLILDRVFVFLPTLHFIYCCQQKMEDFS